MGKGKKVWEFIRNLFGFRNNGPYVRSYLNDANVKSSLYMSFIVILIELWMILRRFYLDKYIPTNWGLYEDKFELLFKYTGQYLLFTLCSAATFIFSLFHNKSKTKATFITSLVVGSLCVLWFFVIFIEIGYGNISFKENNILASVVSILIYSIMPIMGLTIICNALYSKKYDKDNFILSMVVVISFALICLLFGIVVSYSDFNKGRMIICFLTMVVFVACLLIWRPYISILMLGGVFVTFMFMLRYSAGRSMLDELSADEVNYITFLISLTVIVISIYHQRVIEAKKDEKLIHDAIYDHQFDIHNVKYLIDKITTESFINNNYFDDKVYLFINIANFRAVNDQRDTTDGNKFLKKFSKEIIRIFGEEYSSRHADDHFVVVTSINGLDNKIEELSNFVNNYYEGLFIRLKIGGYRPKEGDAPTLAIDKARYACGIIKRKSDVTYFEYTDEIEEKFIKKQYIVNHLDEAIEKGWIRAYYQPVVWADTKEVCGAEALARWIDPKYGFLSPSDFIPVLEETRLIHKLDTCIIEYVCKEMKRAIDEGRTVIPVSINFSRLDFELMDAIGILRENVDKYGLEKKYIHVEITESALANDTENLKSNVSILKDDGYAIWLDDFGSGYSSLNVLKDFMFDVIKIDMKFLSNFETNKKSKDVLDFIVHLAKKLGMKTLTEGVETESEAEFLEKIGCGRLQGYLFGKPIEVKELEKRITNKELVISDNLI